MNLNRVHTIDELRRLARRRLPRILFDFIDGGAGDEQTVTENARQYAAYRLVPRYLIDVTGRSLDATLFGKTYSVPFGIAPTGYAGLYRAKGEQLLAQAAKEANLPIILSGSSVASIETVAAVAPGNTWFQLYAARDPAVSGDLLRRSAAAGIETLVVTVDLPVHARRYRNVRNQFKLPPALTPALIFDVLRHPAWLLDYYRNGGFPAMGNWAPYAPDGARPDAVAGVMIENAKTPQTWRDIERYRANWKGNLVLKGILHPDDAVRAAELGVDGIIVSNHGGRQFDRAPTPTEVLPGIVASVGNRLTVMADGGIKSGADVLIAHALGAKFVFTGRSTLWGLTAGGLDGARRAIEILRDEADTGLAQTGALSIADLGTASIVAAPTVTPKLLAA